MIEQIIQWDKELFLFLNGHYNDTFDVMMFWITERFFWVPFYLLIIFLLYRKYGVKSIPVLVGLILAVALADRISSGFFKPFFARPRPCHEPTLQGWVHLVKNHCGGQFGFVSSHAANSFALAMYLWLLLKKELKLIAIMFVWAFVVSYSRIYLGAHYPLDILCGALLGCLVAWAMFRVYEWYRGKVGRKKC